MTKATRARYTLEFKQEAVRLVEAGQSQAAVAKTLGIVEQTLFNWVKANRQGQLKGADSKPVSAEQMEIARLRSELGAWAVETVHVLGLRSGWVQTQRRCLVRDDNQ